MIIVEDDDLTLVEERALYAVKIGFVLDQTPSESQWETEIDWVFDTEAGADEWRDLLQKNRANIRDDVAIEVAHGDLSIDILIDDGLLKLQSGYARVLEDDKNIIFTVDDIDFVSGQNRLRARVC